MVLHARGRGDVVGIGEIQLQGDAVGIANEYLLHLASGNVDHTILDTRLLQSRDGIRQPLGLEGDVIQGKRIVNLTAGVPGDTYMENRVSAGIKPYARRIERRTIANLESQHLGIELA